MSDERKAVRPAMFCRETGETVTCELCPHNCAIPKNAAGFCGVRENVGGRLFAAGYGLVSAIALDPIEKKPLYRFHPGKHVLSVGGFGCNLNCPFCQNAAISRDYDSSRAECLSPERLAKLAAQTVPDGNIGVAYTYNEPLIGYEFLYDSAKLVREAGLCNVVVTNGYISREPLEKLLPLIDAMNIDLKGFSDGLYKKLGGGLEDVKETIRLAYKHCHVEITTLIIPGENDSEEEIALLADWIASLDPEIPLHLSRFFPRRQYSGRQPTPRGTVHRLQETAKKHLNHVFTGNMD